MKKTLSNCLSKNITFLIITIFALFTFIMQIHNALLTIKGGGVINNVEYTLFYIKFDITRESYSCIYEIWNYPLIPIVSGLTYNTYVLLKNRRQKDKTDSV